MKVEIREKPRVKRMCSLALFASLTTYSTSRSVKVNNKCVALIHRSIQLIILSYIIGYF